MKLVSTTLVWFSIINASFSIIPEDAKLNFTELGIKYGHSVQEHDVVTEDGYILTLFHIPGRKKGTILLVHGIIDSSDTFIIRGNLSLAITLANKGYDVWAGNTRGNRYSRKHKYLNPDVSRKFWDFSFHEVGYYDLPATIDYVLDATGEKSLRSIAHSQGTTAHFVLLSTKPEYNKKIKGLIAMAPAIFFRHLLPPISIVAKIGPILNMVLRILRIEEILANQAAAVKLLRLLCGHVLIGYHLCYTITISPFIGFDLLRVEPSFVQIALGHIPAGTSRKSLMHYFQLIRSKRFANYDYGLLGNLKRYGALIPPSYNLSRVTTNVALIVGQNDALSKVKDVEKLKSLLPREPKYHLMKPTMWNHVDFVWAKDMNIYLYPYIFSFLDDFK